MLRRFLLALCLVYALVCGAVRVRYRDMLYPAPSDDTGMRPMTAREISLTAADGVAVHAVEIPRRGDGWVIVHFHGNGEVVGSHLDLAQDWARRGFGVLLVEYRGYGRSRTSGHPTEEGLYADASAALDHLLTEGVGPDRVVLWGFSLGTGVAAEMAQRGRGARLVLEAPYTSIPDLGARLYKSLVPRWVIADRFDTLAKAPSIQIPTFILHGEDDDLIPLAMGERLSRVLPSAQLAPIRGGHHADLMVIEGDWLRRAILDFILHGNSPILRMPKR